MAKINLDVEGAFVGNKPKINLNVDGAFVGSEAEKKNPNPTPQVEKKPTASPVTSKTTKPSSDLLHQVVSGPSASFSAAPTKKKEAPKPVRQSEGTLLHPTKTQEGLDVAGRFDVLKKGWKNLDTDISTNVNRQRELQQTQLKDLNYSANKLEQDKNKFQQKIDKYKDDFYANPNDPTLDIRHKEILQDQDKLQARLDAFKFQREAVKKGDAVVSQAIKDKNATISELENVWNHLKSAGAQTIDAFDAIPSYAANLALDVQLASYGKTDEFNKLPADAKRAVRDIVLGNSIAGARGSQMAYDYWNKVSEDALDKTIEQEGDTFDDMAKFVSQPSVENAGNLIRRGVTGLADAIPYMAEAMVPGGLVLTGVTSAAGKRMEDINKDGNAGLGYALTSGIHGAAEAIFEAKTNEILKRVGTRIAGNPKATKDLTESLFKEIAKDFNEEGISEGLTTFFQETADKLNKGEPIDLVKLARKIGESYLLGGTIGGGLTGGGAAVSSVFNKAKESPAGKNLLTNALITAEDRKRLEEIRNTTQDLTTQKADDNDPAVNEVIDEKLSDLEKEYREITTKYDDAIEGLTQEEARDLFNIDDKIDEIRTRAEAIKNDPNLTDDAKKLLWQKLKQEFEPLKQQRDAIQKQTTSKVPVQSETGTGLQVAEGEPQAKPEGTTQETKTEKIGQALDADNTFTMRGKEGNLFVDDNGQVLFESGDEIVELGNIDDINNSDLKDFGIEAKEPVAIEIGEDGSIQVAGKKYVNVAEAPMDAITFDQDGNVKSVRLETENGQSRYFRGKRAESIAYQYTLQNLEQNGTDEQIDTIINEATKADRTQEQTGEVTDATEDAIVDEGAKQEKLDLDNVSETSGVKPKNLRQLIRVNKKLFGLSWTKATMSAIAMDRMIGAMAKRAGISKEEMYQRIEFRTKDQNAPVEAAEVVTPQATAEVTAVEEPAKKKKSSTEKEKAVVTEQVKQEPTTEPEPEPQKEETPIVNEFFKLNPGSNEIVIDVDKIKSERPLAYEFLSKYKGFENFTPSDIRNALAIAYTQVMKYKAGAEKLYNQVSELEDIVEKTSPVNSVSKEEFKKAAKESGHFNEAQLLIFNELIDSLNTDSLPEYNQSDIKSDNFYTFARNILSSKDPEAFIHEIGHFAFYNILSKKERLEFLKYMIESSYGPKGKSTSSRLALTSETIQFEKNGKVFQFHTNVGDNFSEYFAEQFRQWYANKNLTPPQFDTIFAKVDKFLRKLIEKLRSGEYVDQSIVKYFEKISTKRPAFENVEITETVEPKTSEEQAYVEEENAQPILWTKVPKQKGDPKIATRNKVIMQAAQDLLDGKITNEEYREIVQRESPIVPIEQFFEPATEEEVNNALSKDKVGLVDSPTEKGTVFTDSKGEEFEVTSDEVALRLDIPAFINNNAWVVTVHGDVVNKNTGKKTKDKAISYGNVARITDVKFDHSPTQAIAVATKKQDKVPFLKMRGKMAPIEGKTMDERAESAKKMVEKIKNDPAWTQIGSNPFKHSAFFNRSTGQPILSADEVIQIGGLVFAKNVKETTWDNPMFEVKGEKGGAKPTDAAGKNVLFQGDRAAVEIASDGTAIIYAMTDPNVSSPLHELAHIFQHYLTEAEWDVITKWAGGTKWSVETSEKFARGFEKFLSEGKAPNKELQKIFDKFKEWLTDIYNGITGSEIDIKLNPAMRKIYAQMFNEKTEKPKEAPSAQKILGIKPKMVTVDEMASLKGQLRLQAKAAKTAYDFAEAARKLVATYIKNNVQGALSTADQKAIFRAMEGKLDTPENKKKMIDKITGILQASEGKIAIKELDALGRMLKSMEKGSKLGAKAVADQIKSVVATIKAMGVKNQLKPAQVRLLLNGMAKNLMNATVRDKFLASAQRVLNNAQYAEELLGARKLRTKIRKTLKTGKEIVDVESAVRNFLKLDPKMIEDLDQYMEYANEIFDAIRNVQVKDGRALGKRAAVLADINAYAAEQNAIQEEINKNYLLDEYNYLVEAGLISGDMSFDEIQSYINDVENNPESSESTKSDIIREFTKNAFEGFANTAKEMLEDGELDEQDVDFEMVKRFTEMDIETLPLDQQMAAVESLENFIVNGVTSRMGAILQSYTGVTNAEANAQSGMKARPLSYGLIGRIAYLKQIANKGLVANILKGVASIGDAYNEVMATYISKADSLVAGVFRSTKLAMKFMKDSGFTGVVRGFVQGKVIAHEFAKKYAERFDGSKPNGMDFKSALNIYERGIFADLSRTIKNGTPEQIKKEFDRKMKQLKLTIEELRKTGKQELIDKADLYDSIYQKIKNAKNIDEVKQNVDPINQAAVKDVQDMWKKYYAEFRRMAADYYNVILAEDVDYVPDMYEKLAEEVSDDLLVKGAFKMAFDVVSTEKVGTLQKNQRIEGLPINKDTKEINRVRDYDFDFNNISALEKTLIDVRTTPFVQQFMGYTNSASFREIFPNMDERALILKRLNFNINALRERQDTYSSRLAKNLNKISTSLSKYGTRIGLGSLSSAPKQSIPMVANTMVNMINDLGSFGMGIADFWNTDAMDFLENSGYGISLRGAESQTSIDFAQKLVERANQGKAGYLQEQLAKLGDMYIEKFLKNPDVMVANMAWLGYYRSKLKSMGVDMTNFDWKNHELNEEAADYAEFMVQDQQNMNVAELGGKLLASKDATTKIIRQLLFPFASYQFNLKDKNNRNLTILTSKTSTNEEKVQAAKSYAAGLVESYTFQTIQGLIGTMLLAAAYSAIGYDEPEEEKTNGILDALAKAMPFLRSKSSSEKWNDSLFVGKSMFEFVAPLPLPGALESYTLIGLNGLMDMIQGGTPKEQAKEKKELEKKENTLFGRKAKRTKKKVFGAPVVDKEAEKLKEKLEAPFRFPVKDEQPVSQTVGDILGGVPSVGIEAVWDMGTRAGEAFGDSYEDKYGNVYEYSDEQKKILKTSLIPRAMVAMNIAPREFLTISNNIVKAVNQKAKEDKKAKKESEKRKVRF